MKTIRLYGERNTGTNYVTLMLQHHFSHCKIDAGQTGWKHGAPKAEARRQADLFVICVRDPIEWLAACHRKPHHNKGYGQLPLKEFLKKPWRDYGGNTHENIIECWNFKYEAWKNLREEGKPIVIWKLGDDSKERLQEVSEKLDEPMKEFVDIQRRVNDQKKLMNKYIRNKYPEKKAVFESLGALQRFDFYLMHAFKLFDFSKKTEKN